MRERLVSNFLSLTLKDNLLTIEVIKKATPSQDTHTGKMKTFLDL